MLVIDEHVDICSAEMRTAIRRAERGADTVDVKRAEVGDVPVVDLDEDQNPAGEVAKEASQKVPETEEVEVRRSPLRRLKQKSEETGDGPSKKSRTTTDVNDMNIKESKRVVTKINTDSSDEYIVYYSDIVDDPAVGERPRFGFLSTSEPNTFTMDSMTDDDHAKL